MILLIEDIYLTFSTLPYISKLTVQKEEHLVKCSTISGRCFQDAGSISQQHILTCDEQNATAEDFLKSKPTSVFPYR